MAAYVIADLTITDPEGFQAYQQRVGDTLARYGGAALVRGGVHETMEGEWQPHTLVIVQFASVAQAWRWYQSPEYAPLIDLRKQSASTQAIVVEGV